MQATPGPLRHRGAHTFRTARRTLSDIAFDVRSLLCLSSLLIVGTLVWCMRQTPSAVSPMPTCRHISISLVACMTICIPDWGSLATTGCRSPMCWSCRLSGTTRCGTTGWRVLSPAWAATSSPYGASTSWWCWPRATLSGHYRRTRVCHKSQRALPRRAPDVRAFHYCQHALVGLFLARWLRRGGGMPLLVAAVAGVFVATTSRYEMWGFSVASAVVVGCFLAAWGSGSTLSRAYPLLRAPGLVGHIPVVLWNLSLSGDPFYFLHPFLQQGPESG